MKSGYYLTRQPNTDSNNQPDTDSNNLKIIISRNYYQEP